MSETPLPPNDFPAEAFDQWAAEYDGEVAQEAGFPFTGYRTVLQRTFELAQPSRGERVLDLGAGTGQLSALFDDAGCRVTGTDFAASMLVIARQRLPEAEFILADLRDGWPVELSQPFHCAVSAYVFHHFPLNQKIDLLLEIRRHIMPGGRMVIADLSFPSRVELDALRAALADEWEEEHFWVADEAIAAMNAAGLGVRYEQITPFTGIYFMNVPPAG